MMTDLIQQVTKPGDVSQLQAIACRVVGETCWKAALSYGDELILHFGEQIPYTNPSMADKKKGAWILGTRGTAWQLSLPIGDVVTSDAEPTRLKQQIRQLEGSTLKSLEIDYPNLGLTLLFSTRKQLTVIPSLADNEFDLPYWELFIPHHHMLRVGPKAIWSLIPSN